MKIFQGDSLVHKVIKLKVIKFYSKKGIVNSPPPTLYFSIPLYLLCLYIPNVNYRIVFRKKFYRDYSNSHNTKNTFDFS